MGKDLAAAQGVDHALGNGERRAGLWTLGDVAVGAADTLTIAAEVDDGSAGLDVVNVAALSAVDQIDGVVVNGTANTIGKLAGIMRQLQTGYLYTYAFAMIIGLTMLLSWLIWFR